MGRLWWFWVVTGALSSSAFAYEECGPLANAYGPFDYRTEQDKIAVVEQYHFTPGVETLKRGATGVIGADLDYTLRASPNHHRALIAMVKWGEKLKTERPPGTNYTIRCYIDRALRFRPDDAMPRLIQANYLSKHGQKAEALKQLEAAKETAGESASANMLYNLGLAYFELGEFDKALSNAHRAYQLGFGLPGLRTKLQKAGKWRDPEPVKPSTDAQAPSDITDAAGKASTEPAQPTAQPQ